MRKVIVNSTPIISLSLIDSLYILKELYGTVFIPKAVYDEVVIKGKSKIGSNNLLECEYIKILEIKNKEAEKLFKTNLHSGEVEVMILYDELNADLCILDDLLARKYAKYLNYNITGTIGVLLKAKEVGLVKNIKQLLFELIKNGIYIDRKLMKKVLELANEN
ncbi:DUF3368 domain-containing protein [Haliovirga abyssi]|uniref:Nucleic acid-binding protein n=1 Tax=Haliovirga abyssi TaxID=2996794 RepID=A0AAU9DH63_9FUSO|nr:DUF3368 domain-containing protein [Haliovirga abyssi]BDU50054.1 nucleic acid-binding protein [Haliovirga abyssi]